MFFKDKNRGRFVGFLFFIFFSFVSFSFSTLYQDYGEFFRNYTPDQLLDGAYCVEDIPCIKELRSVKRDKKKFLIMCKHSGDNDRRVDKETQYLKAKIQYKKKREKFLELKNKLQNYSKELRSQTLGDGASFLANVVGRGVINISRECVYHRLDRCYLKRDASKRYEINRMNIECTKIVDVNLHKENIWGDIFYGYEDIKVEGYNNSDKRKGVMIGYDGSLCVNLYVRADKREIKEGADNTAEIKNVSFGIYGKAPTRVDLKYLAEVGINDYKTKRNVRLCSEEQVWTSKADFESTTTNVDVEISENVPSKLLILKPFAGFSISNNSYTGFKEENSAWFQSCGACVSSGVYWCLSTRVGIGIQKNYKKLDISSRVFSEVFLTPLQPKILVSTGDFLEQLTEVEGTLLKRTFKPGISICLDYKICERFSLSGNFVAYNMREGRNFGNFCLNMGVCYYLGGGRSAEKELFSKRVFTVFKKGEN